MTPINKFRAIGLALAALIFAADQWVKHYVVNTLGLGRTIDQYPLLSFFDLTYAENRGVSLGMFEATSMEMRWFLVGLTALIAGVVTIWMLREKLLGDILALGLILGGALGNIVDRYRFGYVVDYADFHVTWIPDALCPNEVDGICRPFYIFNVADAAITIGVVIILARALFIREKEDDGQEATHETPDTRPVTQDTES